MLLISLGEASPVASAEHRIIATLVGGVLALVVALVVPHSLYRDFGSYIAFSWPSVHAVVR